jgi:hypothetical protein
MATSAYHMEFFCAAIVAFYVVTQQRRDPGFWRVFLAIALGGFVGEDSMIRAYGFYFYAPRWHAFLDQVPLAIVLIWPVVIHSAWQLARQLTTARAMIALFAALIVLFDAALIEPVAVQAGLWWWTSPGFFAVPIIGVLGWAVFAGFAVFARTWWQIPLVAPICTHVVLLALWWAALRWVSQPIAPLAAIATAWVASLACVILIVRRRVHVARETIWARAPGALFFFALLVVHGIARDAAWLPLWPYALAFVPPYATLLVNARKS